MYSHGYVKVPVDAVSSASFLYAIARTGAKLSSKEIDGQDNLPERPSECSIIFNISIVEKYIETFEKLARLPITIINTEDITQHTLVIDSLEQYLNLPTEVQFSKEGLDALNVYSSNEALLPSIKVVDTEIPCATQDSDV